MSEIIDVLIVGGGPAGLSAGIVLAQQGFNTALYERRNFPVDKVCGEGIMPTGVADLNRLGVISHLTPHQYYPFQGIRYCSQQGHVATAKFAEGPGLGIHRPILSQALWQRASSIPNLQIHPNTEIKPISRHTDHIRVQIVGGSHVKTRLLIGADGLNSKVRRWAGLDGPVQALKRWGARQHYQMAPWSDFVEVHWGKGIEAYITPCSAELVEVAFLWNRSQFGNIRGGVGLMPSLLEAFPHLQERLHGISTTDTSKSTGPLHRAARRPVSDGVLLIGDAAGYLDAITGEGISLATAQALALEHTIVPLLKRRRDFLLSTRDFTPYISVYNRIVKAYFRLTRWVLFLSQHPRLAERAIYSLEKQPQVFQTMLSVNMGYKPSWHTLSGSALKLILGMVSSPRQMEKSSNI